MDKTLQFMTDNKIEVYWIGDEIHAAVKTKRLVPVGATGFKVESDLFRSHVGKTIEEAVNKCYEEISHD